MKKSSWFALTEALARFTTTLWNKSPDDKNCSSFAANHNLLASLAFNVRIAETDIHIEGIDKLQGPDIQFASELGYVIKLLSIAERNPGDKISLRVHPTLVKKTTMS